MKCINIHKYHKMSVDLDLFKQLINVVGVNRETLQNDEGVPRISYCQNETL